jgi:hypothetical protein
VLRWVTAYTAEQKRAGVTPAQVTPVFSFDTAKFATQCSTDFDAAMTTFHSRGDRVALRRAFESQRMRAYALVDGSTGQRPGDLAQTLCKRVISFPAGDGYLLNFVSGKTYKEGKMWGLHRDIASPTTCGFSALKQFFNFCESVLGWNMTSDGYVFMDVSSSGDIADARLASPFKVSTASAQLAAGMARAGVEGRRTMSGYRAGTAIRNALQGDTLMECMDKSYWKTGRTALHYLKLMDVLGHSGLKRSSADKTKLSESEYQTIMNAPLSCAAAFRR